VKRAIVCLVGLLLSSSVFAQATSLRFESAPRLALPLPRVRDPRPVLRGSGELTVIAIQELENRAQLVALSSPDGGDSFSAPVPVSLPGTWVFGSGESGPAIALGSRGLCAVWHQARPGGGTDLMVATSDTGTRWSKPTRLVDRAGVWHGYAALASGPDGTVYAAWLDGREKTEGAMDIYLAASKDGGRSFGKNIRVARGASLACRPALTVTTEGAVHVAWRGVGEAQVRDVYLATSRDGGQTFAEPVCLNHDGWKVADSPRSGPTLVASGETLHIAWYSQGKGGKDTGIRWTMSLDGARTFTPITLVSQGVLDANYPALCVSTNGRVHLTFQGRPGSGGWQPFRAYVTEVTSWVTATRGAQAAPGAYEEVSHPTGQFDAAGRLWVLWTAGEAVLLSRAREVAS
jgi:hypothetical protein